MRQLMALALLGLILASAPNRASAGEPPEDAPLRPKVVAGSFDLSKLPEDDEVRVEVVRAAEVAQANPVRRRKRVVRVGDRVRVVMDEDLKLGGVVFAGGQGAGLALEGGYHDRRVFEFARARWGEENAVGFILEPGVDVALRLSAGPRGAPAFDSAAARVPLASVGIESEGNAFIDHAKFVGVGLAAARDQTLEFEELGVTLQLFDLGLNVAVSESLRICGSAELFQWVFGHGRLGKGGSPDSGAFRAAKLDAGVCFDGASAGIGSFRLAYDADNTVLLRDNGKAVVWDGISRSQEGSDAYSREALRLDWQKAMGSRVNVGLEYRFDHSTVPAPEGDGGEVARRIEDRSLGVRVYGSW